MFKNLQVAKLTVVCFFALSAVQVSKSQNETSFDLLKALLEITKTVTSSNSTIFSIFPDLIPVEKIFSIQVGLNIIRGKTKKQNDKRILGSFTDSDQFHFVGLSLGYLGGEDEGLTTLCSCSLITTGFVLYSAHCIHPSLTGAQFFFGSVDISNFRIVKNGAAYAKHPAYNNMGGHNDDIALFKLAEPVEISGRIQTINLPPRLNPSQYQNLIVNEIGYGIDSSGLATRFLKYLEVEVSTSIECFLNFPMTLSANLICSKYTNADGICFGDSGGALIYGDKLIGINNYVSSAESSTVDCKRGFDAFTRVDAYLDWITFYTKQNVNWV